MREAETLQGAAVLASGQEAEAQGLPVEAQGIPGGAAEEPKGPRAAARRLFLLRTTTENSTS